MYFRYASLYFCCAVEDQDNELITLEIIHRYVELLDKYFGSVCFCLSGIVVLLLCKSPTVCSVWLHDRVVLIPKQCLFIFLIIFIFKQQVCELDIIFNFEKAYFILDEFLLGGEAQETSKKNVLKAIEQADLLQEVRHLMSSSMVTATVRYLKQGFCDFVTCGLTTPLTFNFIAKH